MTQGRKVASKDDALPQEIERKFLVRTLPDGLDGYRHRAVVQGYLQGAADGTHVRLRRLDGRQGAQYVLTVKQGRGLRRTEVEVELSEDQFAALWPLTAGRRVRKVRYYVPLDGATVELDVYQDQLDGLCTAEAEFEDEAAATAWPVPDWFGRDVTDDDRYGNVRLAVDGRPDEPDEPKANAPGATRP